MTDTFITQCPHCQTRFNLKRSQLKAAQGEVRCGTCLQVFNAAADTASAAPVETRTTADKLTIKATPDDQLRFSNRSSVHKQRPKKNLRQRWLTWILFSFLSLLLLLGLYTYSNFAQLAHQDSTRPWLAAVCPLFGCQLPSQIDIQQIKSSNLEVRSHPEFSGALLIDAIIYNRAAFSQAFPLVELNFINNQGQALTSRPFKPQEYLGDKYSEKKQMPPQTPIHITLEVLEPDSDTTNYSFNFVSPDSP